MSGAGDLEFSPRMTVFKGKHVVAPLLLALLDLPGPDTYLGREKLSGNDTLSLSQRTVFGLPILSGGAEIIVPWNDIARVEAATEAVVSVTYRDGSSETAEVEPGELRTAPTNR